MHLYFRLTSENCDASYDDDLIRKHAFLIQEALEAVL